MKQMKVEFGSIMLTDPAYLADRFGYDELKILIYCMNGVYSVIDKKKDNRIASIEFKHTSITDDTNLIWTRHPGDVKIDGGVMVAGDWGLMSISLYGDEAMGFEPRYSPEHLFMVAMEESLESVVNPGYISEEDFLKPFGLRPTPYLEEVLNTKDLELDMDEFMKIHNSKPKKSWAETIDDVIELFKEIKEEAPESKDGEELSPELKLISDELYASYDKIKDRDPQTSLKEVKVQCVSNLSNHMITSSTGYGDGIYGIETAKLPGSDEVVSIRVEFMN